MTLCKTTFSIMVEHCYVEYHYAECGYAEYCGAISTAGARTNFSLQDKTWVEFSTLELAICRLLNLVLSVKLTILKLKTQPKQLVSFLPLAIPLPGRSLTQNSVANLQEQKEKNGKIRFTNFWELIRNLQVITKRLSFHFKLDSSDLDAPQF